MINQNHLIFLSFGKRGDTGGGDYLGEHWIKGLRDLITMSFFKYVMIVKLKMRGNFLVKFVSKNY